jgi:hypothetical protein
MAKIVAKIRTPICGFHAVLHYAGEISLACPRKIAFKSPSAGVLLTYSVAIISPE